MTAYLVCNECGIRDVSLDTECCDRCGKNLWLDWDERYDKEEDEAYEEPGQYPEDDDTDYIIVEH